MFIENSAGFKAAKHMVFAGVYPADGSDFEALSHAIERLTCNDASVSVTKESSGALGMGFRFQNLTCIYNITFCENECLFMSRLKFWLFCCFPKSNK